MFGEVVATPPDHAQEETMIGPAELEDICLDLQAAIAGPGTAAGDTFHPCFHPDAAMIPARQHESTGDDATAADQPSWVSSNSSWLSIGTR